MALWAVGTFFGDPLNRLEERPVWSARRRLWGNGPRWELEWTSYPFASDLVAALTEPVAGIEGTKSVQSRRGWDVVLGDSILALRRSLRICFRRICGVSPCHHP